MRASAIDNRAWIVREHELRVLAARAQREADQYREVGAERAYRYLARRAARLRYRMRRTMLESL